MKLDAVNAGMVLTVDSEAETADPCSAHHEAGSELNDKLCLANMAPAGDTVY